jgi:hypothetical protein
MAVHTSLEHYVMGASPSPRARVLEAIDRYLVFFLSLIAAAGDTKKRKPKVGNRGKATPD